MVTRRSLGICGDRVYGDCLYFLFRFIPTQTWDQGDAYKERNKILDQDILTIFKVVYKLGRGSLFTTKL